jgi:POT family proton-dependent oligopeptide transporter
MTTATTKQVNGHPKGLYLLFATEMWERFSYYGMRGLLMLYMTKSAIEGGLGFSDDNAGLIYGIYTGLVYLTPIFGGWLADTYLGQRKSITIGGITMAIGQFCLFASSAESMSMFYLGLLLLILGNGFFKPNISTVVGQLYPEGDKRKDAAFTIFYMGINLGAFLAPLVCGFLAEDYFAVKNPDGSVLSYGFGYGFLAAGIGMILGQLLFNSQAKSMLGDLGVVPGAKQQKATQSTNEPLTAVEKSRLSVIVIMMLFNIFFWAGFEQAGSSISLYTDRYINRDVTMFGMMDQAWTIPTSWFQSVNPLFIVLLGPIFTFLWTRLSAKDKEPNSIIKMGLGMILLGVGFFLMIGAAMERGGENADATVKANLMWLVGTYLIHTMGELCLSPVGLSLVTKLAPVKLGSLMMGVWFLSSFVANFLSGYLVQFFGKLGAMNIFAMISAIVIALGLVVLFLNKRLLGMMHGVK